jgi:hypothetical protein
MNGVRPFSLGLWRYFKLSDGSCILVTGHTRPELLKNTLQSLTRQGAISKTHVWLDGHQGFADLIEPVYQCRSIAEHFRPREVVVYSGRVGIEKLMLDALTNLVERYDRLIVLEDDCFPTYDAIQRFEEGLDEIDGDPSVYSVYGHHFLLASEGETITRFQGWGWATTSGKLRPVLDQLRVCFSWSEPQFIRWVEEQLTPGVRAALSVTPGRNPIETIRTFFCWDGCTCVITAARGLRHRKTSRRVVYNCGMGERSGHFPLDERFLKPPINMIVPSEVWQVWEG